MYDKKIEESKEVATKNDEKSQNKQIKQQKEQNKARKDNTNKKQWLTIRNKYKRDKHRNIPREVEMEYNNEVDVSNPFDGLKNKDQDNSNEVEQESTKD